MVRNKVRGNIYGDANVRHQMTSVIIFSVLLLYSFIKSMHRRFLCRQCRLKALAAVCLYFGFGFPQSQKEN